MKIYTLLKYIKIQERSNRINIYIWLYIEEKEDTYITKFLKFYEVRFNTSFVSIYISQILNIEADRMQNIKVNTCI